MSITNKIKSIVALRGKSGNDMADYLQIGRKAWINKLYRGSYSIEDIIKIADALGYTVTLTSPTADPITFTVDDIRDKKSTDD